MTRVTKAAIACFVLMGGLTLGSAAASAQSSSSGGSIQVWLTPSLTGKGGKILITGAIADSGVTKGNKTGKAVLKKGTITVNLTQFQAAQNNANPQINQSNCSGFFTASAPVPIVSGTGAYAGISGSFTLNSQFAFILPKTKSGACNTSNNANPISQYGAVSGSGTVTLP
ncbi:MAG TPA: hypothetical protein VMP41_04245 [Acidimicrobiales bacterium]|nr:hypothetical protein [Acidimicrobiales bacterium]